MQPYQFLQTKLYIPPIRPGPSFGLTARTGSGRLVSRPRLIERLSAGLDRKLALISAPAGFGKTTLISEWVHQLQSSGADESQVAYRIAWLSLDDGDNDAVRFLAYLIGALQTIESDIGQEALSTLQSPQPPPHEGVLTPLLNEIAVIPGRIVFVLDDYHLMEAQPIHDALAFLLEHLPPRVHLVIVTREDPHLPLARLRAKGQLTEVRATDLRFTLSEAAEFLNQVMGLVLSAEEIAALEERTEGWIAGLQLAAISMQGREDTPSLVESFTGSHRYVLDYLVEEVFAQISESVQTFLLRTSILDRLCGPLCDSVLCGTAETPNTSGVDAVLRRGADLHLTPSASGQDILEYLEHANLFIVPLDEERRWYRYHHLFSDLLRRRLRQMRPEWVPTLHLRASEWYEQNGFTDEAIEHALGADDLERAAALIERHVDATWQRGEHTKLRRWLAGLPAELVLSRPHLCILHAWDLFTSGQQDAADQSLQAAEEALDARTDLATEISEIERDPLPGAAGMMIQGRAAAIRALLASYRGDVPAIHKYSRQALEYLPKDDLTWRSTATVALGDAYSFAGETAASYRVRLEALETSKAAGNFYMILIASMKLAVTLRQQGLLQQVMELCQQQLQLANESGLSQTVVIGWLLAIWGEVLAELNDLDGALHRAKEGAELTERGRDVAMIGWSSLCLMRVLFTSGDLTGAQEVIHKMEDIAREYHVPPWITSLLAAWQARIWLAQDRLDSASQWVKDRGLDTGRDPAYQREAELMVLARILMAQGRLSEAGRLLQRLLEAAETGGRTSRAIELLLLQAQASQARGEAARGMARLERALTLAEPGGFIRIFVEEGPPMAQLLRQAAARGIMPDYTARLVASFEDATKDEGRQTTMAALGPSPVVSGRPTGVRRPSPALVEPLSERELEVLQLIAEGLTNREIASRLFLSLNTVKAHTRNIYGKLGVRSRTQAVARARALGVLPLA
ncbi:LuxR C-terminal-related transcriptional regulator [Chloroflexota bacterium]